MANDLVNLKIDGKELSVPKGTNLIEAAKTIEIEIPHYCYHKHLSIAGNCRMCQVEIKGQPKLTIACNTLVQEGMEVSTHHTSKAVADAQKAVLEFILINHPLDCTVCDQSGHCKLQDYHFEYSRQFSRFVEEKVHKVKALPLGPTVILDGERCIMCTRCIRFCDELTKTSELGMLERGDRSVISINPGKILDNPLSATVVDLCPVGALTHRKWRFNTRIWFTKETNSICTGCSTGCNVKVAVRDQQVVMVKARRNDAVNKEWLCDEGRYGFDRFLPPSRVLVPTIRQKESSLNEALSLARAALTGYTVVFVATDLLLEEYEFIRRFFNRFHKGHYNIVLSYKKRELTPVQQVLISPDYAPNFRGAQFCGLVDSAADLQAQYEDALEKVRNGIFKNIVMIGDRGILRSDADDKLVLAVSRAENSLALLCDSASRLRSVFDVVFPARSILEKSGLFINQVGRLQYVDRIVGHPVGTYAQWKILNLMAEKSGGTLVDAYTDRALTLWYLASERRLSELTIAAIKNEGVDLNAYITKEVATQ